MNAALAAHRTAPISLGLRAKPSVQGASRSEICVPSASPLGAAVAPRPIPTAHNAPERLADRRLALELGARTGDDAGILAGTAADGNADDHSRHWNRYTLLSGLRYVVLLSFL